MARLTVAMTHMLMAADTPQGADARAWSGPTKSALQRLGYVRMETRKRYCGANMKLVPVAVYYLTPKGKQYLTDSQRAGGVVASKRTRPTRQELESKLGKANKLLRDLDTAIREHYGTQAWLEVRDRLAMHVREVDA